MQFLIRNDDSDRSIDRLVYSIYFSCERSRCDSIRNSFQIEVDRDCYVDFVASSKGPNYARGSFKFLARDLEKVLRAIYNLGGTYSVEGTLHPSQKRFQTPGTEFTF